MGGVDGQREEGGGKYRQFLICLCGEREREQWGTVETGERFFIFVRFLIRET